MALSSNGLQACPMTCLQAIGQQPISLVNQAGPKGRGGTTHRAGSEPASLGKILPFLLFKILEKSQSVI